MQGLADGYFVIPYTIGDYLASDEAPGGRPNASGVPASRGGVRRRIKRLSACSGKRTVDAVPPELGKVMWEYCGMARNEAGSRRRSEDPGLCAGILEGRQGPPARRSLNQRTGAGRPRRRFPGIRRTARATTPCTGTSPAAGISARSTRRRTARPSATKEFCYVAAWEYKGDGNKPEPAQGTADVRKRETRPAARATNE